VNQDLRLSKRAFALCTLICGSGSQFGGFVQYDYEDMQLTLLLTNRQGKPVETAELWCDDGQKTTVWRIRPGTYGRRLEDGSWQDIPLRSDATTRPGQIRGFRSLSPNEPRPKVLRIAVLRDGEPTALLVQPLSPQAQTLSAVTLILD